MLVIPLAVIVQDGLRAGPTGLWQAVSAPVAWHALKLTLWTAAVMALINAVMGTLTAYVLVRYSFPA
jgi:sulfate transport system permease protein